MKKTLTPKEQELIPKVRDEWINLFFSLKFNEKDAKELMKFIYKIAGFKKPKIIILDSPIEVQKSAHQCDEEENVGAKVSTNVREEVWTKVWRKVRSNVWAKVRSKVWENVQINVRHNVWYKVREKVRDKLNLKYIPDLDYGTPDDFFLAAFYDYFQRIGIFKDETFTKYKDLIKANIFYIVSFKNTCFISRPPLYIKRDEDGELHSEKGYAIEFKDGWGLRYIHGEFVEEDGE
jgi:hypothetical protein